MNTRRDRPWIRRLLATLVLAGLVSAIAWAAMDRLAERFAPEAARTPPPPAVTTMTARVARVTLYSPPYRGTIEARTGATVTAQVTARILERPVTEGDRVDTGDLLVRMDTRELGLEVEQLQAAGERLEGERATARRNLERQQALHERGSVSDSELDDARQRVSTLDAQARENQAALERARIRLDHATEHAPFPARVSRVHVQAGDLAVAGQPLVELVNVDDLRAVLRIPETDGVRLQPGMAVELEIPALGRTVETRLDRLYPTLEPPHRNGSFQSLLSAAALDSARPGMAVEARVALEELVDVVTVPAHAVQGRGDGRWVYVVRDRTAHRRPVTVRSLPDGRYAVVGGVRAGDRIITTADHRIRDGAPVNDIDEPPQ